MPSAGNLAVPPADALLLAAAVPAAAQPTILTAAYPAPAGSTASAVTATAAPTVEITAVAAIAVASDEAGAQLRFNGLNNTSLRLLHRPTPRHAPGRNAARFRGGLSWGFENPAQRAAALLTRAGRPVYRRCKRNGHQNGVCNKTRPGARLVRGVRVFGEVGLHGLARSRAQGCAG